jgi:hypothetical protein
MMALMDDLRREKAIRLLRLFLSAGTSSDAAMHCAWVLDLASQNGLDDQEFLSGLDYAAEQSWLKVERKGLLLTEGGKRPPPLVGMSLLK